MNEIYNILKIAKKEFMDNLRNKWMIALSVIFLILILVSSYFGTAQTRRNDMLLQHGTILLKVDIKKMFSMLNVSEKKIEDKEIKRIEDRVTSVEREFGKAIDGEEIVNEMIYSFSEMLDAETYEEWLTEDEINNAELLREKYESKEWNFKR